MKLFVWDFHGVLEKDNEKAVIEISNKVLEQAGYNERFTDEDNERYYGLKWYQYYEKLLPGLSPHEYLELQAQCFAYAEKDLTILTKHIKPNDHANEVLEAIHNSQHQQLVISNSRPADIIWFLEAVGQLQFFAPDNHVIGVNAHQKHGNKTEALQHFLKNKKYENVIVIGDSEGDMQLGKAVGAKTYFYKHPHRQHEDTTQADILVKDLREVLREI